MIDAEDIIIFISGFMFCMILAGAFTLVVDKGEYDIDIDEDIRKFKKAIKSIFKKKKPDVKKPEQTKKEINKKIRKMFRN